MRCEFTKMQSLGNDFIVLDGIANNIRLTPGSVRRLANRHFGIGCDQVLLVQAGKGGEFVFRIYNQDGSEAEQCGNGARCLARFLCQRGLADGVIRATTGDGKTALTLRINADESVTVNMGVPEFAPDKIPFLAEPSAADMHGAAVYPLELDCRRVEVSVVAIGNPHAVQQVDNITAAPVGRDGPLIENHPKFPARVNAGFMRIAARNHIHLRVYERGVGETLGCGSGACAAVAAGIARGLLDDRVTVSLPGGDAIVAWQGNGEPIYLTGPAHTVFTGVIELPDSAAAK